LFQTLENQTNFSKTLYVGNDMLNDIWTATEAGCRTVLFAGDQRSLAKNGFPIPSSITFIRLRRWYRFVTIFVVSFL